MTIPGTTYTLAQLRKTLISVAGFVVAVLTAATAGNLVPEQYLPWALGAIGFATSVGVFLARNADTPVPEVIPPPVP